MDNLIQSNMDDIVVERRIIKRIPGCEAESIVVNNTDDAGMLVVARKLREEYPEAELTLVLLTYGNYIRFQNVDEALGDQEVSPLPWVPL